MSENEIISKTSEECIIFTSITQEEIDKRVKRDRFQLSFAYRMYYAFVNFFFE